MPIKDESERTNALAKGAARPVMPDFEFRELRQPKRAELIADEIRHWIVSQDLRPGDRLPTEKELIRAMASSRGSVREGLKILEAQGLVQITAGAGGGARVALISYENANHLLKNFFYFRSLSWRQVYDFRLQIEPAAAELATPHLTDEDFERLEKAIHRCVDGRVERISRAEQRLEEGNFHRIIAERCPNPMLRFTSLFVSDLLIDYVRYRNIIDTENDDFGAECLSSHRKLIDLLRRGKSAEVAAVMRDHVMAVRSYLGERERLVDPGLLMER